MLQVGWLSGDRHSFFRLWWNHLAVDEPPLFGLDELLVMNGHFVVMELIPIGERFEHQLLLMQVLLALGNHAVHEPSSLVVLIAAVLGGCNLRSESPPHLLRLLVDRQSAVISI